MPDNKRTMTIGLPLPKRSDYEFDVSFLTRQYLDAMTDQMRQMGWDVYETIIRGINVADHHNQLAVKFKGDWLLIVGSDHGFMPDAAMKLVDACENYPEQPRILASLMPMRNPPYAYVANNMAAHGKNPRPILPWRDFHPVMAMSDNIMAVDVVGSGFTLYHRSVFDKVPYPYFLYAPYLSTPKLEDLLKKVIAGKNGKKTQSEARWLLAQSRIPTPYGPDYYFCVKAKDYGIQSYVHFGVRVSHFDYVPIMHDNYIRALQDSTIWNQEALRAIAPTEQNIQEMRKVTQMRDEMSRMSYDQLEEDYKDKNKDLEELELPKKHRKPKPELVNV